MRDFGHDVTVFAGPATVPTPGDLRVVPIVAREPDCTGCERTDNPMPPGRWESEDAGYRAVLAAVAEPGAFDVVHNNSLHYLPPALSDQLEVPMVHTLHSPPFDTLHLAHLHRARHAERHGDVVAVSDSLRRTWGSLATTVVPNGVRTEDWTFGDAPDRSCVWMGRIVPEKAPHLAIDAARLAGRPITLAGPVQHMRYFEDQVKPRLGADARWVGHLDTAGLSALCRSAAVGVVTPQWDEPFGLVIAEMLACGTPVAAFARGAITELVVPGVGATAPPDDVVSLAGAIDAAARLDRQVCRKHAVAHLSARAMAARYVGLYRAVMAQR
ncbi:MAG: glycosyltransferase [Ilumatobacteraceae bacterium]